MGAGQALQWLGTAVHQAAAALENTAPSTLTRIRIVANTTAGMPDKQRCWSPGQGGWTHNEYQLHEEADEAHHHETNSCLGADPVELCSRREATRGKPSTISSSFT